MTTTNLSRRRLLTASGVSLGALALGTPSRASQDGEFQYEVQLSEAQWRERLSEDEYRILRLGQTEAPKTSPLWQETRAGNYHCRGCELHVYSSEWNEQLDKGWVFFRHGVPNSQLMGIDWPDGSDMMEEFAILTAIETHCRRCGSHLGHILIVDGRLLHCINGTSLTFAPSEA